MVEVIFLRSIRALRVSKRVCPRSSVTKATIADRTNVGIDPANRIRKHGIHIRFAVQRETEEIGQGEYRCEETSLNGTADETVDDCVGLSETSAGTTKSVAQNT